MYIYIYIYNAPYIYTPYIYNACSPIVRGWIRRDDVGASERGRRCDSPAVQKKKQGVGVSQKQRNTALTLAHAQTILYTSN